LQLHLSHQILLPWKVSYIAAVAEVLGCYHQIFQCAAEADVHLPLIRIGYREPSFFIGIDEDAIL